MKSRSLIAGALVLAAIGLGAQTDLQPLTVTNEDWERPFAPLRIVGNLYYVGTYDLASFLITTPEGHILINSGVASSVPMIRSNIERLGFDMADVKIITTTHAHWDHVAGLGEIKRLTGAQMQAHAADAVLLESGGNDDYRYSEGRGLIFEPVAVDRQLTNGDTIELGGVELTVYHHPGHTKGATSFSFTVEEGGRSYDVLIANMGSVNASVNLAHMPGYPNIAEDYAATFASQKRLTPDIWTASHAGQFGLHEKYTPGDTYDPDRFVDPEGYRAKVEEYERLYIERLARERAELAQ